MCLQQKLEENLSRKEDTINVTTFLFKRDYTTNVRSDIAGFFKDNAPFLPNEATLGLYILCLVYVKHTHMKVILRHKDLHAYGKICESVHKTASANKICKRKISFVKV